MIVEEKFSEIQAKKLFNDKIYNAEQMKVH